MTELSQQKVPLNPALCGLRKKVFVQDEKIFLEAMKGKTKPVTSEDTQSHTNELPYLAICL